VTKKQPKDTSLILAAFAVLDVIRQTWGTSHRQATVVMCVTSEGDRTAQDATLFTHGHYVSVH
jgi:hypothetical protein